MIAFFHEFFLKNTPIIYYILLYADDSYGMFNIQLTLVFKVDKITVQVLFGQMVWLHLSAQKTWMFFCIVYNR